MKVLRAERNFSEQDLATELGVSRQTIKAIEAESTIESDAPSLRLLLLCRAPERVGRTPSRIRRTI